MTTPTIPVRATASQPMPPATPPRRLTSMELMDGQREVEIEHMGKIYRLRVTQLNKLILTA